MKTLFLIFCFFIYVKANATDYYFSSDGNDNNSGISKNAPWKSLFKLNLVKLQPGDNIFLNRGNIFYGSIHINQSGEKDKPITITAYGTGAKPVITGFTNVNGWTNLGNNIWESTNPISELATCNMVAIQGVNTGMGRTPNKGYYAYESFSGNTSITSSATNSATINWTGADAIIRKTNYSTERNTITDHRANTLTYALSKSMGTNGYGFFIENDERTLDTQNEWYYNPSTKKLKIYSNSMPAMVQAATIEALIQTKSNGYITVDGISLQGGNTDGFSYTGNTDYIVIQNCDITFIGDRGIRLDGGSYCNVNHNNISDCGKTAIYDLGSMGSVTYNNINRISIIEGQSDNASQGDGIKSDDKGGYAGYNVIKNIGSDGISYRSKVFTIQYNFIDSCNLINTDNGGIYTGGPAIRRIIDHNIVLHVLGRIAGTTRNNSLSEGIYLDELCNNTTVTNNTVAGCGDSGIKLHKTSGCNIAGNTCYNNSHYQIFIQNSTKDPTVYNDTITNNIFFSTGYSSSTKYPWVLGFRSSTNDIASAGVIDNNFYARPANSKNIFDIFQPDTKSLSGSLDDWKKFTKFDANSHLMPEKSISNNDMIFEYNPSAVSKVININGSFSDVKGNLYNNKFSLSPYSSVILLKNR